MSTQGVPRQSTFVVVLGTSLPLVATILAFVGLRLTTLHAGEAWLAQGGVRTLVIATTAALLTGLVFFFASKNPRVPVALGSVLVSVPGLAAVLFSFGDAPKILTAAGMAPPLDRFRLVALGFAEWTRTWSQGLGATAGLAAGLMVACAIIAVRERRNADSRAAIFGVTAAALLPLSVWAAVRVWLETAMDQAWVALTLAPPDRLSAFERHATTVSTLDSALMVMAALGVITVVLGTALAARRPSRAFAIINGMILLATLGLVFLSGRIATMTRAKGDEAVATVETLTEPWARLDAATYEGALDAIWSDGALLTAGGLEIESTKGFLAEALSERHNDADVDLYDMSTLKVGVMGSSATDLRPLLQIAFDAGFRSVDLVGAGAPAQVQIPKALAAFEGRVRTRAGMRLFLEDAATPCDTCAEVSVEASRATLNKAGTSTLLKLGDGCPPVPKDLEGVTAALLPRASLDLKTLAPLACALAAVKHVPTMPMTKSDAAAQPAE